MIKHAAEAKKTGKWLDDDHPEWAWSDVEASRIGDIDILRGVLEVTMMQLGKDRVSAARRAIIRYEDFCILHSDDIIGGAYPPTTQLVAWFLYYVNAMARFKAERRKVVYKGTAAKAVALALAGAHAIFGAPFPPSLMESTQVKMARGVGVLPQVEDKAHWSVAVVSHIEELAGNSETPTHTRDYCKAFLLTTTSTLRCVEALRSKVVCFVPRASDDIADTADSGYVELLCAGGKPTTMAKMKPFRVWTPDVGVLGKLGWLGEYAADYAGKEFMFRSFTSTVANDVTTATGWATGCASEEQLKGALNSILALPPLSMTSANRKDGGVSGHGARTFLVDATRAKGWGLDQRGEIGRWKPGDTGARASRSQANNYSRDAAARTAQLKLRRSALRIITDFLAGRPWTAVVPMQIGVEASFAFLCGGAEDDEVEAEESLDAWLEDSEGAPAMQTAPRPHSRPAVARTTPAATAACRIMMAAAVEPTVPVTPKRVREGSAPPMECLAGSRPRRETRAPSRM